jgi:hypothetical protein
MLPDYDDTLAYLEGRYLTLQGLADASGLAEERLLELIDAGCLPDHSHEATFSLRVEAVVNGSHPTADKRIGFYHPDLAGLAREAEALVGALGLAGGATEIRRRHDDAVALAAGLEAGSPAHRDLAERTWAAWRNGTYGVCLQEVATPNMIRKVMATELMKGALEQRDDPATIDADALDAALARYASVTGPFGPHERDGSTRALVYEPALALRRSLAGYVPS